MDSNMVGCFISEIAKSMLENEHDDWTLAEVIEYIDGAATITLDMPELSLHYGADWWARNPE